MLERRKSRKWTARAAGMCAPRINHFGTHGNLLTDKQEGKGGSVGVTQKTEKEFEIARGGGGGKDTHVG